MTLTSPSPSLIPPSYSISSSKLSFDMPSASSRVVPDHHQYKDVPQRVAASPNPKPTLISLHSPISRLASSTSSGSGLVNSSVSALDTLKVDGRHAQPVPPTSAAKTHVANQYQAASTRIPYLPNGEWYRKQSRSQGAQQSQMEINFGWLRDFRAGCVATKCNIRESYAQKVVQSKDLHLRELAKKFVEAAVQGHGICSEDGPLIQSLASIFAWEIYNRLKQDSASGLSKTFKSELERHMRTQIDLEVNTWWSARIESEVQCWATEHASASARSRESLSKITTDVAEEANFEPEPYIPQTSIPTLVPRRGPLSRPPRRNTART
ncbi:hypothetical protein PHLCEN_2v5567 [Hermanssonia centrifuga]|uniref:Uncharacterized protein n=1 Tax=Hermanssonia centrifuga TaxID=98765 RepID=A0A2R6P231_9APHY|nr:hypothetical protein PHLCEN_2v5567 [Hermanssonia centrifuga]